MDLRQGQLVAKKLHVGLLIYALFREIEFGYRLSGKHGRLQS